VAAAAVGGWPAVAAIFIVLIITIVWVALGPTFSSTEIELGRGTKVHQSQLTFARRAPLRIRMTSATSLQPSADEEHDVLASTAIIRAWAISEGMAVHRRGPLPRVVIQAWKSRRERTLSPKATEGR
jgi:hypothetical protein